MAMTPETRPVNSQPPRAYSWIWMRRIFVCALVFGVLAALWKAIENARESARYSQCFGDFKGVGMALYNYHAEYGSLPPAYLTDKNGKPTLSWRVLILPYWGEESLYSRFDLSEPWDGPNNIKLLSLMPRDMACPNHYAERHLGFTKCVAITGPGTFFPGAKSARFADASDGPDQSVTVAEIANLNVPWTAPVDLDIRTMSLQLNDRTKPGISTPHPREPTILMGNGSIKYVRRTITPEELKAILTISGHEPRADEPEF